MKNLLIILFLSLSLTANSQHRNKECITTQVEHLEQYKVKVTITNTCKNTVFIKTYLKKEWDSIQKKRKKRSRRIRKN